MKKKSNSKPWDVPRDMTNGDQWHDWSREVMENSKDDGDWRLNRGVKYLRTRMKKRIWPPPKRE